MANTVPFSSRSSKATLLAAGVCALAAAGAWTGAAAQTVRGIHDLPSVTLVQPKPEQASPAPTAVAALTVQEARQPEVLRQAAHSFVEAHAAATAKINQIPRWHDPICTRLVGLPPDQTAKVENRIASVAKSVGVRVMKPGCTPNIEIEFTDQPQQFLDQIAAEGEPLLGYHYPAELERLKTVTHPVQAWYATATSGGGGGNAGLAFAGGGGNGTPSVGAVGGLQLHMEDLDAPDEPTPTGCADSRMSACLTSKFANVLIVADSQAVAGKDLGTMGDYIAMLALSQPRSLDDCKALVSIMDLFAKACAGRDAPDGLTPADASYLTALYGSDPEAKLSSARDDIAGRMAKILIRANAKARPAPG